MMNRKEFYEYVKDNVKEYLPESYKDAEIKLQEAEKNNGLKLTGITIPNGDQRIVPTVYLDSLYQEYIHGKDVDSCVGDVADMRIEAQGKAEFFDMGVPDILDYEKMKNKLQVRICDKEWNTDRLADKVVTEHGDFAAYYAVNLEENGEGISSIPVTVSLMNEWGVSVEQIQADAMMADKNRGVQLVDMNEIIKSMIFGEEPENLLNEKMDMEAMENPMFCLTNKAKMNGAWDVRDGVFPEGFVNDAFEAFSLLIERLCTNLKVWEQVHPVELPLKTGKVRKSVNKTEKDLPDKMLHEGFYNCLQNCPDEIALIAAEGTFSYKKLGSYVAGIQNELCKSGFRKGDFVAISADKGMWQIAAVLAVLFSGGVYLPFDVSQPIARQNKILEKSGTKYLITNKKYQSLEWKEHIVVLAAEDINRTEQALTIVEIPLENPAYIIHTSGTTGDPKGVVISHKAAVNTIEDINSRFDINSADRMFGLANLAFDLSVYDIFGAFNAGAALVLPDPEKQKDPYYWVETIKKNEITVWNSVPAQMQMLVSVLESRGVSGDFPLKVVLLSGDWIPVTLPDQIHTSCKKAKVVSLGGATEAAIWSIYHEIEEVPDGAVSIPYGKPLANQKFYVLNEKMEQCPDWVPGDLYIGGKGLALEYLNKPEETNAHFMYDEQLQERIYKTGDIGRYWPDGTIEFMGREDTQVKIHGHRIELSEIESALLSNTLVKTAVAVIVGKRPQDYKIVAFVEGNIEVSELTEYIKTQVPEYMVPSRFEVNEKIPLSANGKVERKALKKLAETYFQNTGKCEMPPHEGLEKEIAELWKTLLKIDRVNRTDNFYDIGGDSLLVAQAVSKTKEAINVAKDVEWDRLMIGMLQNPTIMDFAQFLNSVQIGTSHEENEISETPLNIIADIPEGGEVMKVFFPGGIGFLQQFNTLFQILVNNPERTEGIAAFNYTEDKALSVL